MLKAYVIGHVKPDVYYASRFPHWNPKVRGNVRCPFHDDKGPSLSVALRNGGARCHGSSCHVALGNIVHFESTLKGISEAVAARKLYQEFIRPVISKKVIQEYRDNLATNTHYLLKIKKDMGLVPASVRKFSLGLDLKTHRITIPIYDQFGFCVNIRFYRLPSERNQNKDEIKIYNLKGYGRMDLFPIPTLDALDPESPIYFMAGEKDTMLGIQEGLPCITTTTGEGSWDTDWNSLINGRTCLLVYDRDKGGTEASRRIASLLSACGADVREVEIPFKGTRRDRKDFTDWILREKGSGKLLASIAKKTRPSMGSLPNSKSSPSVREHWDGDGQPRKVPSKEKREYPKLPDFYSDKLHDLAAVSSNSALLNRRIRTQGIVAAKSPNTYSIPWRFEVRLKNREPFQYEVPMGRELLRFIRSSDAQLLQTLQKLVGSSTAEVVPIDYLTATEVEVIPTAAVDKDAPYVVQRCYYFGDRIESNVPFYLELIPTSEIRTQETIGIITQTIPLSKSIDKFELTPEIHASLSVFSPDGGDVWAKLKSVAREISHNHTHIYNRLDWHLVALLTWCSPIGYFFPGARGTEPERGWLSCLALGDTETGKSAVAKKFQSLFGTGVFANAENCTFVGLIGGAIKMGSGQLMLRWGRIPLSDKQLVILEELSGLSVDEISDMSNVRSSGTAYLDKGGINAQTSARTRLLCLSNVRSERKGLANYLYGVYAIRELIGHGEDIARFDLITTLIDKEVSTNIINAENFASVAKTIHADQMQMLVHFIWSLTPEQIVFTQEAYEACLDQTKKLALDYHPSIPIFKGGSGRYKIGRIALAIASLQFSYCERTKGIQVDVSHVLAAVKLMRMIYDKPSFGYKQYSEQMFDRETIKTPHILQSAIVEKIPRERLVKVLESLIHSTRFTRDELCAVAGLTTLNADQLIGTMIRERALRKGDANIWEIEPAGKLFMEKLMQKYEKTKSTRHK